MTRLLAVLLALLALLWWMLRRREAEPDADEPDADEPDADEPDYGQPDVYVESVPCVCGGKIAVTDDVVTAVEHQQSLRHLLWRRREAAA